MSKETLNNLYDKMCYADTDSISDNFKNGISNKVTDQEQQIRQKYGEELPDIIFNLLIDVRKDIKGLLREVENSNKMKMIEDCNYNIALLDAIDKVDSYIRSVM